MAAIAIGMLFAFWKKGWIGTASYPQDGRTADAPRQAE